MSSISTLPPLRCITDADFQNMVRCVWDWHFCGHCNGKETCNAPKCSWSRKGRVRPFLDRYQRLCLCYMPEYFGGRPALSCHGDLLALVKLIKSHPMTTKKELMEQHFSISRGEAVDIPAVADQDRAFNLAASILLSINCGVPDSYSDTLEDSTTSLPWAPEMSITGFVASVFSQRSTTASYQAFQSSSAPLLSAKLLGDKTGLLFQATDDLHRHLTMDLRSRIVYVFGCTVVLEEMLAASPANPQQSIVPRELVFEVLQTIYEIMFPPGRDSDILAAMLARKGGFDRDFLRYTVQHYRRDDDSAVTYSYFGERLKELSKELEDPSPRNWFERLFEDGSQSAERKMLMATTIGVFIAVTIGLFGLVIAGFQAWVGYQQWKHPVKDQ